MTLFARINIFLRGLKKKKEQKNVKKEQLHILMFYFQLDKICIDSAC